MKKIISYLKTNKNVVKYLTDEDKKILKQLIISILGLVVVTATGVEPTTAGAEIQCSIQLSYAAIVY